MVVANMDMDRCRLCGRKEGQEKFKNIFDEEPGMGLDEKINKLLPIVVVQWDPLPHGICENCFGQLNSLEKFYDATIKTDKFLKGLLPFQRTYIGLEPADSEKNNDLNTQVSEGPCSSETEEVIAPVVSSQPEKEGPENEKSEIEESENEKSEIEDSENEKFESEKTENEISETENEISEIEKPENEKPETILIDLAEDDNEKIPPKRDLSFFFIIPISPTANVYACRQCYNTYTTEKTAISHICKDDPTGEPPREDLKVKLRLSRSSQGYHICDICKASFSRKSALRTHLKQHIRESVEADSENEEPVHHRNKKKKKEKKRKEKMKKSRRKSYSESDGANAKMVAIGEETHADDQSLCQETDGKLSTNNNNNIINKDYERSSTPSDLNFETTTEEFTNLDPLFKAVVVCTVCGEVFLSRKLLWDHQKIHENLTGFKSPPLHHLTSDEESFKEETCQLCDKVFQDKTALKLHQDWHLNMSKSVLTNDRFRLSKRKKVVRSDSHKNGSKENIIVRRISSTDEYNLAQQYNNSSTGEDIYICQTCNATFSRKSTFAAHEMSHITQKSVYDYSDEENEPVQLKKRRKSCTDKVE